MQTDMKDIITDTFLVLLQDKDIDFASQAIRHALTISLKAIELQNNQNL